MVDYGKWSQSGIPHKDWVCLTVEDLEDSRQICEMCEFQEIRYVHYMQHSNYPGELAVGCDCAGRMEENKKAAQKREGTLKNTSARRKNWLARTWKISAKGNDYLNTDGFNIVIFKRGGGWSYGVIKRDEDEKYKGPRKNYLSKDRAKFAAFDRVLLIKEKE